jgi:hypothetical protein
MGGESDAKNSYFLYTCCYSCGGKCFTAPRVRGCRGFKRVVIARSYDWICADARSARRIVSGRYIHDASGFGVHNRASHWQFADAADAARAGRNWQFASTVAAATLVGRNRQFASTAAAAALVGRNRQFARAVTPASSLFGIAAELLEGINPFNPELSERRLAGLRCAWKLYA